MSDIGVPRAHILADYSLADLEPGNRLLRDYLLDFPRVTDFFAHPPFPLAERTHARREPLAEALAAFQQQLGANPRAIENARRLADSQTPVVTTGQQTGLLTGPLYTICKALTAIDLADRLGGVAVFWAATDDDDRSEADSCACLDSRHAMQQIRYPEEAGHPGALIGDLPAGPYAEQVIEQARRVLEGRPFAEEVVALLQAALNGSPDMGTWCCRLLARLLSAMGLVVCDPRLPAIRQQAARVIRREIAIPLRTTSLVNGQARVLHAHEYRPALTKPADACNFFLLNGVRRRVHFRDGQFVAGTEAFTPDELLRLLDEEPERFVPNAVLRPVVQEYLFGSAAFVSGPNELGYWAELRPVFQALEVEMPPVVPRAGVTLAPLRVARALEGWGEPPLELYLNYEAARHRLLEQMQPATVTQAFEKGHATVERLIGELSEVVSSIDRTLGQSALATHQAMVNELERLARKTQKAVERRHAEEMERLQRAREALFPGGSLQERVLNITCLLAQHGPDFPETLRNLLAGKESRHLVVEIGG